MKQTNQSLPAQRSEHDAQEKKPSLEELLKGVTPEAARYEGDEAWVNAPPKGKERL